MSLNHVHLGSARFAETQAFYERFFGFKVASRHGQGAFLKDQEGFLLVLDPVSEPHVFPAWFHLGFCQSTERAVHELHAAFQVADIPLARQLLFEPGEFASFYVQDPDGVRIEVSWHAK